MLNIVQEATLPPATCIVTGSASGPFLDCGRAIRGYGRVYLSVPYLRSITPNLGYVPAPELAKALEDMDGLVGRVRSLENDRIEGVARVLEEVASDMRAAQVLDR